MAKTTSQTMLRRITQKQLDRELGFGKNLTTDGRMMNPDGSFNVVRQRSSIWDNTYYYLVTMPWWMFLLTVTAAYVVVNTFFALLFLLAGFDGLKGLEHVSPQQDFMEAFFFSSQTLTTVGYGSVSPTGLYANIIASFESLTGLLSFALISGLMYGRFARPRARVVFSDHLLVSPYRGGKALMFRMVNARRSELIETEVQVILTINQLGDDGAMARKFYTLQLELSKISFFSLSWTIVHALAEESPLFGFTQEDIMNGNLEVLVLVKGTDEANQQTVYARRSYVYEDLVWNARFTPIISRTGKGLPNVLTRNIDSYEMVG